MLRAVKLGTALDNTSGRGNVVRGGGATFGKLRDARSVGNYAVVVEIAQIWTATSQSASGGKSCLLREMIGASWEDAIYLC